MVNTPFISYDMSILVRDVSNIHLQVKNSLNNHIVIYILGRLGETEKVRLYFVNGQSNKTIATFFTHNVMIK